MKIRIITMELKWVQSKKTYTSNAYDMVEFLAEDMANWDCSDTDGNPLTEEVLNQWMEEPWKHTFLNMADKPLSWYEEVANYLQWSYNENGERYDYDKLDEQVISIFDLPKQWEKHYTMLEEIIWNDSNKYTEYNDLKSIPTTKNWD